MVVIPNRAIGLYVPMHSCEGSDLQEGDQIGQRDPPHQNVSFGNQSPPGGQKHCTPNINF
eukprot:2209613-Amphidinium_carterae.1